MKKTMYLFGGLLLALSSCTKVNNESNDDSANQPIVNGVPGGRNCGSQEALNFNLAQDPGLRQRMEAIEQFTEKVLNDPKGMRLLSDGTIEIPVVVNVVYKTAAQNISQAQIQSQIDVLNEDFKALNADYNNTPSIFTGLRSGSVGVSFVLDQVIRKSTNKTSFTTNNGVKKASGGGIAPTSPTTKLNIWSCNLSGGVLGYAQFPGGASATDGVVIDDNAFGRVGTVSAPFNKGRTATHEVGHWMNLRHIWGDATCGSDLVSDTPPHNTANYGCPTYPHRSTCTGTPVEMTMNYMDYTDDACMYMFSAGQKSRMQAVFAVGGPRASFR